MQFIVTIELLQKRDEILSIWIQNNLHNNFSYQFKHKIRRIQLNSFLTKFNLFLTEHKIILKINSQIKIILDIYDTLSKVFENNFTQFITNTILHPIIYTYPILNNYIFEEKLTTLNTDIYMYHLILINFKEEFISLHNSRNKLYPNSINYNLKVYNKIKNISIPYKRTVFFQNNINNTLI